MNDLRILVDGEEVDYLDDSNFPITFYRSVAEYTDLSVRKGERSYTIKLPLTQRNQKVFGSLQLLEQSGKFKDLQKRNVIVTANNVTVTEGKLYIKSVSEREIEAFIIAQVGSIASAIEGKSLRDLNTLPAIDFKGFDTIIANTEEVYNANSNLNTWTFDKPICFPIVCYGRFFVPNVWTSSNITRYLPSVDYIPSSTQSFTSIPLPDGREILGLKNYYLSFRSQPHFGFEDMPPAFFVAPILKAIFSEAGYELAGKWINRRDVQKLLMPYVNDRPPIYNWSSLGKVIARDYGIGLIDQQTVAIKYTAFFNDFNNGGNFEGVTRHDLVYDRQFILSPNLYPVPFPTFCFSGYNILYNVLNFRYATLDNAFCVDSSTEVDQRGVCKYSTFTAKTDGVYSFTFNFILQENKPYGTPQDTVKRENNPRAFGCTKIEGDIPDNLCNGKTYDHSIQYNNLLYFKDLTNEAPQSLQGDIFKVELKRGERVVFWIGMLNFDKELKPDYGNNILEYHPPYDVFSTQNPVRPTNCLEINYDIAVGVQGLIIRVNVDNLPTTPARDRFSDKLQVAHNLPDIKQSDYLKTLTQLFNLYLILDESAKIAYLDTADDFYLPVQSAYDITQKTNRSTFVSSAPDLSRYYQFKWNKDDKDEVTKRFGGNYDYKFDTQIGQATAVTVVDSGIFASTEFRKFDLIESNNLNDFVNPSYSSIKQFNIPHMASNDDLKAPLNDTVNISFDYQPRLLQISNVDLFVDGEPKGILGLVKRYDNVTDSDADSSTILQRFIQLSFADTRFNSINLQWNGDTGLHDTYYKTFFYDLSQGFEAECEVLMTPYDYRQMQINRPIHFDGNIFYLKEISGFSPVRTKPIKITLIKKY